MIWKDKLVNLSNYGKVFSGMRKETLEVIRSALFDCTPIEKYIVKYSDEPYKLWQIKLALDENLDTDWFDICPSGDILSKIRELKGNGINLIELKETLQSGNLSELYCSYIVKWFEKGICLSKYNFSILPENLLSTFDYGFSLGFPMEVFNSGEQYSHEYVVSCLKLMSNNKEVGKFLGGDWDLETLSMLADYSRSKYYDKMIDYVHKNITPSVLEEIYKCCKAGMPLKDVSSIDEDGFYVYSWGHIKIAREAFLRKFNYESILKPDISLAQANSIFNEMDVNASKKLSGRLR